MPFLIPVPRANGDHRSSVSGSIHQLSATSTWASTSQKSVLQFRTVVKMLAPAIWSNLEAKRKKENPNYKGRPLVRPSSMTEDDSNGKLVEPIRLEEQLDMQCLEELMYRFKTHMSDKAAVKAWRARRGSRAIPPGSTNGLMTMEEFRETLAELLNVESWDSDRAGVFEKEMGTLFTKVDIASDGLVDWDEFCTYMMIQFKENDVSTKYGKGSFSPKLNIARISHNKETTTKILRDFNPMRYVTISKEGIIGVWSTELELQRTIDIEVRSAQDKASNKRHIKMWVTDAVTMNNVHKLVVATTNMDLYFYDMSTPIYTPQYHLCAIGNVPLCLNYYYNIKFPASRSMLFFGTDNGSVHAFVFPTPVKGLFETPFKKTSGSYKIFFQDICVHSRFVTHLPLGTIHSDWVRRVQYVSAKEFIISCSSTSRDSLVVRDVDDKKRKTYVFKVAKGIDCFDYNHALNVIVTGGVDHAVRVWNPYVTSKPIAIMKGHQSSIVDLIIHQTLAQVFSYDKDGVLKCWEIKEQVCIQSLTIRDPFGHREPEHGPFPFCLICSPVNSLLIASNDSLVEVKLLGLGTTKAIKTTHAKPLCAALYNEKIEQVITGCEGSVIGFWDILTGRKATHIPEAHGNEEISCMHLDRKGSRLMTGARDGSINVWNANNGHLLNKLAALEEMEVTGITSLPSKYKIITVGWHRKIITYHDDRETFVIRPNACWKGGQVHQDDILASAFCPPYFLATASFDGDIILWSLDREKMIRILKKGSRSLFKSKMMKVGLIGRDRKLSRAQAQPKSGYSPVDRLLFLTTRAQNKSQDSATLVSSENGALEFWCLYGTAKPMGRFCAAKGETPSVLALATDPSNDLLLTGDSNGHISIWDISSYCISRAESIIAQVWSTTQRMASFDDSPEASPPQVISWSAHTAAVVSLEVVSRDERMFVISASSDCTARLWTLDGDYVGMFGQKTCWDIDDAFTYVHSGYPWNEEQMTQNEGTSVCGRISPQRSVHDDVNITITTSDNDSIPMEVTDDKSPSSPVQPPGSFLPQIQAESLESNNQINEDPLSWTTENHRSMTSLVLDRRKPDTWSILGHKYNDDFRQRMQTRQSRRNFMGFVDQKLTSGGSLGNHCSPFQALQIPDTQEYDIPSNLPVTKRMLHKASKTHADSFLAGVHQGSLPVLPAIKRSESPMTMTSLNKESQVHNSENASQFSFIAEP